MDQMDNQSQKKNKHTGESLLAKIFIAFLAVMIVVNIFTPDKKMSEEENRVLQHRPKPTVSGVLTGSFMKNYEKYLADQFAGRNILRKIKVSISRVGGSKKEQDVFIGKEDQLFEDIVIPEKNLLKKNVSSVKKFAEKHNELNVNVLLVPDTATILNEKLPMFATVGDQKTVFESVKRSLGNSVTWIDAVKPLSEHKDEKIYYKTDHHWTSLGAYYTFVHAAPSLHIKKDTLAKYKAYPVTTDFNGTLAAKSGTRSGVEEQIDIYVPENVDHDLIVNHVNEKIKMTTMYHRDKLSTRDKYAVFFGGNEAVIDIKTVSESHKRLLVVKDSYANCFIPFLTPYYREIVMVDPRYYSGAMDEILQTYSISDVLFLYSGNTFFQDTNLEGVLQD